MFRVVNVFRLSFTVQALQAFNTGSRLFRFGISWFGVLI